MDSFEHFAVLLGWILLEQNAPDFTGVPQLFSRGALHVTDFTLYSTASKYMLHNFQCSEDKVMNSIFPTKKDLRNSFFIVVHENDMLVPTWEHGHVKDYAL